VKDAKKNEKKLQELLQTRERDITQLRSLRSDTFEGPPTFYEETIQRLNNQLQMLRRDTWEHEEQKRLMEEKSRMHQRAIDAYSDLHKRSAARYADYEASIKLRDETESQLRHRLQEATEELQTSRQTISERVEEFNQLRVLPREEAELYGRASSAQHHHITELEESLENVRILLTEANRDLGVTTKNYETAVKKTSRELKR
jgi:hypothetical protein